MRGERVIGQGSEGIILKITHFVRDRPNQQKVCRTQREICRWKVETKVRRMIIIMKY